MDARLERLLNYPVEPQAEWQCGVFDFSDLAGGAFADSPMSAAKMVLWVSRERELIHGKPSIDGAPLDLLILELLEFTELHKLEYRPARICVTDQALASQLNANFAGSGTTVTWNVEPDFWCEVKESMGEHMRGTMAAPSLAESGCSLLQIHAYAEAAAAFYRARPWQYLDDADLLQVQTPKPPKHLKHVTVLGAGRQEFGLGFYDSSATHWDMLAQRLNMDLIEVFSLTFNPISEAIESDAALWKEHDFPLETGDAFPQFLFYSRDNTRAPKPKELEYVTVLLAALAETTEAEIDSGEWSKQILVQGKKKRCKISIPDLLAPPDRKVWLDRGMFPEPRGNERHFRLVQAVIAQNEGMELEDLNALINQQFTGSIDDFDYPSETPFDRAENLCYAAIDAHGRRRIQLIRQALQEDPTHIESNVLLAESVHETSHKIELFRQAVEFGEAQFADLLETAVGQFWEISETRPLMRAKTGLANSLAADGQANEAIAQMLDILRLNSNDNQGVRYQIIPLLLSQHREKEAVEILDCYPEETGNWLYLKAQIEFRREGRNGQSADKAIAAAIEFNPHVIELLIAGPPPTMPERYTLGSAEEAAILIEGQMESWSETEGFIEWMCARFAALKRDSSKRRLGKKRKRGPR
ncbi:tetratricopeptide repeat protein [Blastopirellula marina]|uniref:DUF7309 domain-containing protein n=1 Tax=Blastopirellula marina DSM 3645 TaxID=314230 RepID=A3ZQA2_9BACT|nr:hypothetical protein [Blastopirellula marina]EAQ81375.1 hypothetical protein DSM3645_23326 [Blastopirellula marina DSM 3645]